MDEEKKVAPLTDDDVHDILKAIDEAGDTESNKFLASLPSNNGVEETHKEETQIGYEATVTTTIDPDTGAVVSVPNEEVDETEGLSFDELYDQAVNKDYEATPVDITEADIAEEAKKNDMLGDIQLDSEEIVEVMRIANRVQAKEKFNVFKALPDKVKTAINTYISDAGMEGNSYAPQVNSVRNDLAEMLINEFITNISINKYSEEFQKDMNALQNKVNEEFSKMYKDYDSRRTEYINKIIENEEDEEKKIAIGGLLDAINDGFALNRIKEACRHNKIRIKKFDLEKPSRPFDGFLAKYYKQNSQNIYSIYTAAKVMHKHFKDDMSEADVLAFFIAICKYCLNYKPEVPQEHAFMYYAMYNAVLLDVYKGEDYDEFATAYKANVLEIVDMLKNRGGVVRW